MYDIDLEKALRKARTLAVSQAGASNAEIKLLAQAVIDQDEALGKIDKAASSLDRMAVEIALISEIARWLESIGLLGTAQRLRNGAWRAG